jgi:hypothetical protein
MAVKPDKDLAIRKLRRKLMGGMHGECGLTHTSHSPYCANSYNASRRADAWLGALYKLTNELQLGSTASERCIDWRKHMCCRDRWLRRAGNIYVRYYGAT